jgi:GNAT superfamily N-acetyltransferase
MAAPAAGMAHYHRPMNSPMTPVFRAAGTADIAAVVALVESAYRGESGLRGWTTESHLLDGQRTDVEDVTAVITRPGSLLLLAEHDGRLLACCQLERQGGSAYFGMFAVTPLEQGGGLGKRVLAAAESMARDEWQCRSMTMTVIEQRDELIAFYERRGYRRTGEYKPFPYGDERFGIPRRADLRFELLRKDFANGVEVAA